MINTDKVFYWLICIVAICLPFSKQVVGISTGLLIILTAIRFSNADFSELTRWIFWSVVGFFIMHVVCLVYTADIRNGLSHIEMKLSMLAFPLIFTFCRHKISRADIEKVLLFFAGSMTVVSIISLAYAGYRYLYHQHIYKQNIFFFYYSDLVQPFDFSPSYYSMYVSFAALILVIFLIDNYVRLKLWQLILGLTTAVFLSGFNVLLSARMPLIAFFIVLAYVVISRVRIRTLTGYAAVILGIVCILAFFALNRYTLRRVFTMDSLSYTIDNPDFKAWNAITTRIAIWKTNAELLTDNWLLGVGRGDADHEVIEVYREHKYWFAFNGRFNLHNEYLQTIVSVGIVGLILLLMTFWLGLYRGYLNHNWFLIAFLLLVMLCFISESVLGRLKGVLFFSFFISLLGINHYRADRQ